MSQRSVTSITHYRNKNISKGVFCDEYEFVCVCVSVSVYKHSSGEMLSEQRFGISVTLTDCNCTIGRVGIRDAVFKKRCVLILTLTTVLFSD